MPIIESKIQGNSIGIGEGTLTEFGADAIVVPQYNDRASYSGQNRALLESPANEGMRLYNAYVRDHGDQEYGTVIATAAIKDKPSPILLHAVMVRPRAEAEAGRKSEFKLVQTCAYNALVEAEKRGLNSIAFPALGADTLGYLSTWQSAQAMMSAVAQYAAEGRKNLRVSFVVPPADIYAKKAFNGVLMTGGYVAVDVNQPGKRDADLLRQSYIGRSVEVPTIKNPPLLEAILKGEVLHRPARHALAPQGVAKTIAPKAP